jgi:hypothetical protein
MPGTKKTVPISITTGAIVGRYNVYNEQRKVMPYVRGSPSTAA